MPKFRTSIQIDAPADKVWDAIADFPNVHRFNPSVTESHGTSAEPAGVGATRHCALSVAGATIEERVTDWNEGESYTIEVYDKRRVPLLTNNVGHVAIESNGDGCIGVLELSYDVKGGPIGRLLHRLGIKKQSEKGARLFVAGLKHFVETGEEVTKGVRVDTSEVEFAEL